MFCLHYNDVVYYIVVYVIMIISHYNALHGYDVSHDDGRQRREEYWAVMQDVVMIITIVYNDHKDCCNDYNDCV